MNGLIVEGDTGKKYIVEWSTEEERYTCSCPDYKFRQSRIWNAKCKHIVKALEENGLSYNRPTNLDVRYRERSTFLKTVGMLNDLLKDITYKWQICGSWRRGKAFVKDIDVVVWLKEGKYEELRERIELIGRIDSGKEKRLICKFVNGELEDQVDFRLIYNPIYYGSMLCHCTGSKEENIRLRKKAISLGYRLNEYGLYDTKGEWICGKEEEDIYRMLNESYREANER